MNPEILIAIALIMGVASLILALYSLFSPVIRSEKRIKASGILAFPSSPELHQRHTFQGKTWRWNGTVWKLCDPD